MKWREFCIKTLQRAPKRISGDKRKQDWWWLKSECNRNHFIHETAPIMPDVRCDIIDGCWVASGAFISHELRAICFVIPKVASVSIRKALDTPRVFPWIQLNKLKDAHKTFNLLPSLNLDGEVLELLTSKYGAKRANTILMNLLYDFKQTLGEDAEIERQQHCVDRYLNGRLGWILHSDLLRIDAAERGGHNEVGRTRYGFESFYDDRAKVLETYKGYFKFAVVRNSWEKMVSNYIYWCRSSRFKFTSMIELLFKMPVGRIDFKTFVRKSRVCRNCHWEQQVRFLPTSDRGEILLDAVVRLEELNKDWESIRKRLGIDAEIGHLNVTSHHHYREYYDSETRRAIQREYREDIERFGFAF